MDRMVGKERSRRRSKMADERGMLPVETETGIQLISVNLLLDNETDPVIWRGPVIGSGRIGVRFVPRSSRRRCCSRGCILP